MEIQRKLKWESFESLLGTWALKIKPFFDSGGFEEIYSFLKKESGRGKRVAPLSENVFRVFKETELDKVKVVILSYCPYHTFYNGTPIADGLAFSCSVTNKLQPSLISWYEGLEDDLCNGLNIHYIKSSDLSYLSKQGVLLWNSSLTVFEGKPGSHQELWETFTKYVLENILMYTGIPIILIGKDAQKYERYVSPLTHGHIFKIEHPSFAARNQMLWNTEKAFSAVNKILKERNNESINWFELPDSLEEEEFTDGDNGDLPF